MSIENYIGETGAQLGDIVEGVTVPNKAFFDNKIFNVLADLVTTFQNDRYNVKDYGATGDGSTDDSSAVQAAIDAAIAAGGGNVIFPIGSYLLSSQVSIDITTDAILNVVGYGAEILTSGAISGLQFDGTGGAYSMAPRTVYGLRINHRNNNDATFGFEVIQGWNIRFHDCTVIANTTKTTYAAFKIGMADNSDVDTGSFWTKIVNCWIRKLSGSDSNTIPIGVHLKGNMNATVIRDCGFNNCDDGVLLDDDGATPGLSNGVLIDGCAFEGCTDGVHVVSTDATDDIKGLRIVGCRGESLTNFLNYTLSTESAVPPFLAGNFLVSSVTNYITNSNGLFVNSFDCSRTPSIDQSDFAAFDGGGIVTQPWTFYSADGADDILTLIGGGGRGIRIRNGATNDDNALTMGWSGTGDGAFITFGNTNKGTIDSILGLSATSTKSANLRGSATFASAGTVAVSFGTAEPDATYFVAISGDVDENFWVTAKGTGGFTINSDNASSTATVDWILIR